MMPVRFHCRVLMVGLGLFLFAASLCVSVGAVRADEPRLEDGWLEHVSAEAVGLPPHYWDYLRHSWEWSELYDPETARQALTQSVLDGEHRALYAVALEAYRKRQCDVLDIPLSHPSLAGAFEEMGPEETGIYYVLWWACLSDHIDLDVDWRDVLAHAEAHDGIEIAPIVTAILYSKILEDDPSELFGPPIFVRAMDQRWGGDVLSIESFEFFLEYNKSYLHEVIYNSFQDAVEPNDQFKEIFSINDQGSEVVLDWDDFYISGLFGLYIQEIASQNLQLESQIKNKNAFCFYYEWINQELRDCMRRASRNHISCYSLFNRGVDTSFYAYSWCRTRYMYHFSPREK